MAKTTLVCMYEQPHDSRSRSESRSDGKERKGISRQQNTGMDKIPRTQLSFFLSLPGHDGRVDRVHYRYYYYYEYCYCAIQIAE